MIKTYNGHINHGTLWDSSDLRELVRLYNKGTPMMEISERLGRSITACADRLRMIKIGLMLNMEDGTTIYDVNFEEVVF